MSFRRRSNERSYERADVRIRELKGICTNPSFNRVLFAYERYSRYPGRLGSFSLDICTVTTTRSVFFSRSFQTPTLRTFFPRTRSLHTDETRSPVIFKPRTAYLPTVTVANHDRPTPRSIIVRTRRSPRRGYIGRLRNVRFTFFVSFYSISR